MVRTSPSTMPPTSTGRSRSQRQAFCRSRDSGDSEPTMGGGVQGDGRRTSYLRRTSNAFVAISNWL